ncbi:unnamed protein product [Owenia fusiformis]|uniref:EF-hand domain-containing protein n=1 Tax=Owenia fusiformis TaxID=6347 RepID=A0A8S4PFU2_OWEFU|nr:unnamed protein product [Owenia fusiformis]
MKVYCGLLALVLISALVLPGTDASWFRRVVAKVKSVFCNTVVSKVCSLNGVCRWVNRRVCGKRDLDSIQLELRDVDDEEHVCPIPVSFDYFDTNEDDYIDAEEMARGLNMNVEQTKRMVIDPCDIDGDDKLSEPEFEECPLVFENRELDSGKEPKFVAKQRKDRKKQN